MSLRETTHRLRMEASDLDGKVAERTKVVEATPKLKKLLAQLVKTFSPEAVKASTFNPARSVGENALTYRLLNWDTFSSSGLYAAFTTPDGRVSAEVSVGTNENRAINTSGTNLTPEQARAYGTVLREAADFHEKATALLSEWSAEFKKAFPKS